MWYISQEYPTGFYRCCLKYGLYILQVYGFSQAWLNMNLNLIENTDDPVWGMTSYASHIDYYYEGKYVVTLS